MLLADRLAHPLGRRLLTPLDFDENLMGWWDASKLRLDDNDPVATWPDLSGNGLDFTAQTANPPVFAARAYNGRGAVRFDDDQDRHMDTDTFPEVSQPGTVLIVCASSSAAGYEIVDGQVGGNRWVLGSSGASAADLIVATSTVGVTALSGSTWSLSVIAGYWATNNSIIWDVSGNRHGTGNAGSYTITGFRLGRHATTDTRRFDGDICELAIWARAVPPDQLGSLARDLAAKWGI